MDDCNKQIICRLCFEITPVCDCEAIKEIKKEILEVLHINIDSDVNDYAVACNKCRERLQDCLEFKSRFTTSVEVDNNQVCRFCVSVTESEAFNHNSDWQDGVLLKDMIRICFPEMDLNGAREPIICNSCIGHLKRCYEFLKMCQEVELRIDKYCQLTGCTAGSVILAEMLKFEDYDMRGEQLIIKKEYSDVENDNVDLIKCSKSEEIALIKRDEIDIKDELENSGKETSDFNQSEDSDSFEKDGYSTGESEVQKDVLGGRSCHIKMHACSDSEEAVDRCTVCFGTDTEYSPIKVFCCIQCAYETGNKCDLQEHLVRHEHKSHVLMHKCHLCSLKSKYRWVVSRHWNLKHSDIANEYNCKDCSYSTKRKDCFLNHQLLHKERGVLPERKCEKCEFKSRNARSLVYHMLTHEDPMVANKFQCGECSYRGKRKNDVKRHMKTHLRARTSKSGKSEFHQPEDDYSFGDNGSSKVDGNLTQDESKGKKIRTYFCSECPHSSNFSSNIKRHIMRYHSTAETSPLDRPSWWYNCKQCPFSTKYKDNFLHHQLTHENPEEVFKYKCDKCDYKTRYKTHLANHVLTHEDPEVAKKFKCEKCTYRAKRLSDINRHMLLHSKEHHFSCDQCTYSCSIKHYLVNHKRVHHSDKKEGLFECDRCDFRTKHKQYLQVHKDQHDPKVPTFKCDQCDYCTRTKYRLLRHSVKHRETGEYYCERCGLKTKYKGNLARHVELCEKMKKENDEKEIKKNLILGITENS